MTRSPASNAALGTRPKGESRITITDVFRNLSDEKCLELRTEEGFVFHYQSIFDRESETTIDTVRANGREPQVSVNLEKGNQTTNAMETLFSMLPSNVAKPVFL